MSQRNASFVFDCNALMSPVDIWRNISAFIIIIIIITIIIIIIIIIIFLKHLTIIIVIIIGDGQQDGRVVRRSFFL